ncbi:MAG: arginine--tRNA ligase [bacterium]
MYQINSKITDKFTKEAIGQIFKMLRLFVGKNDLVNLAIDYPPELKFGDFTLPCFALAKSFKKAPEAVASELKEKIKPAGLIKRIKNVGPYLNFFVDKNKKSKLILNQIMKEKESYGQAKIGQGKKIMIEYISPNTNKPLHLGHVRNALLGTSLVNLLGSTGHKIIRTCLINDRGNQISQSMAAYEVYGQGKLPDKKPDHFVGDFYVRYHQEVKENPALAKRAKEMLLAWEKGDKEVRHLWQKMNGWFYQGFKETLKNLGISFDKFYYESQVYLKGKKIISDNLKKGIFQKQDGAVVAPLEKYNLPAKVLIKSDGTAVYTTTDIYLAFQKFKDYKLTQSIYLVGSEQDLLFRQLFKILELIGFKKVKQMLHLSYGIVNLPEGKMKSREGKVVDADNLLAELEKLSREEIIKRYSSISEKEKKNRSQKIARAALKYFILEINPKSEVCFEPKKSLSFTGRTGPYLLYTYARLKAILRKAKKENKAKKIDFSGLENPIEQMLVNLLGRFPAVIVEAALVYDPSILAKYLYSLADQTNSFYHDLPVLQAEEKLRLARLKMIEAVSIVLKEGLAILGIETVEEM